MANNRVGLYLRISRDHTGEKASVARQRRECMQEISAQADWELVDEYEDNDKSATDGTVRPNWERLLADVRSGRIDHIVAWARDRLSRDTVDTGLLEREAKRLGVLITIHPGTTYDLTEPGDLLNFQIQGSVAGFEGNQRRKRQLSANVDRRMEDGEADLRTRVFGYLPNPEKVGRAHQNPWDCRIICEREAAEVEWLYREVLNESHDLVSYRKLARSLNARGVLTSKGNQWSYEAIKKVLANPTYAGIQSKFVDGKRELYPDVATVWTPIVDRETWKSVQGVLKAKATGHTLGTRGIRKTWISGVLTCAQCKRTLNQNGNQMQCPPALGHQIGINKETSIRVVEGYIISTIATGGKRLKLADSESSRVTEIRARLRELDQEEEDTLPMRKGKIRTNDLNAIADERDALHDEIARANAERSIESMISDLVPYTAQGRVSMEAVKANLDAVTASWRAMSMEQKHTIAKELGVYMVDGRGPGRWAEKRIRIFARDRATGDLSAIDEDTESPSEDIS